MTSRRAWAVLGSATFTVVFHVVYVTVIAPAFAYDGSFYAPVSEFAVWIAGAAAIIPSLWLPERMTRPSQVALWLIYLVGYIPASLVMYYVQGRGLAELWPFTFVLLVSMAILGAMDHLPRTYWVVPIRSTSGSFSLFLMIAAIGALGYIAVTVGINFQLPNILEIADTRASFGDAVQASGTALAYIVVWSANVIAPLLIAMGLRRGRLWLAAVGVVLELVIYGITGFKTALFSGVLIAGLVALLSTRRRPSGAGLAWIASSLVIATAVFDNLNGSIVVTSIFVRRLLEVPALVTSRYFEYFSSHPTYNLAHSFLRTWFRPPSQLTPPQLIGSVYYGPETSANGGLWADGFANFGFPGTLVFAAILGCVFWLLDVVADGTDLSVTGSIAGLLSVTLTNSGLFTTMVSHGLGVAIILIAILPRREADPQSAVEEVGSAIPPRGAFATGRAVEPTSRAP